MRTYLLMGLIMTALVLTSCNSGMQHAAIHSFDLPPGEWTVGYADLPADHEEELYQLESGYRALPSGLDGAGLYIQGHNRSDDLFMFIKREIGGLKPRTRYRATFVVNLATNVPEGLVGIGGSPGESVYLKAGATTIEPMVRQDESGYLRINIDKGNQARSGTNMINLGNIAHPGLMGSVGEKYMIKTLDSAGIIVKTISDADGRLWIIIGTDSGFEGLTALYYGAVSVVLEE